MFIKIVLTEDANLLEDLTFMTVFSSLCWIICQKLDKYEHIDLNEAIVSIASCWQRSEELLEQQFPKFRDVFESFGFSLKPGQLLDTFKDFTLKHQSQFGIGEVLKIIGLERDFT